VLLTFSSFFYIIYIICKIGLPGQYDHCRNGVIGRLLKPPNIEVSIFTQKIFVACTPGTLSVALLKLGDTSSIRAEFTSPVKTM